MRGAVLTLGRWQTDGTYAAYGQKLTIDCELITFIDVPGNPRLDTGATRPNTDVRVGVQMSCTALNPRIRLFSEPEMSEIDKLSWLVRGEPAKAWFARTGLASARGTGAAGGGRWRGERPVHQGHRAG